MTQDEKLMNRLHEHLDAALINNPKWFFLALQGSWNYDLGYENSDVDSKILVLPSFEDFALNHQPKSYTHVMPNEEHVDVKDIRLMFQNFWKQNINFLEILFTKYVLVNPLYEQEYNELVALRERIAFYDPHKLYNCMCGMGYEKFKALKHPYPTIKDKIEKYGYDGKQLHHILRMEEFMRALKYGQTFEEALTTYPRYGKETLLAAKRNEFELGYAEIMAQRGVDNLEAMKNQYKAEHENVIDEDVRKQVEDILIRILKKSFLMEMQNE